MSVESWLARSTVDVPSTVAPHRSRRTDLMLAVGVAVALLAAVLPLLRVIDAGAWMWGAVLLTLAVLGAGFAARWVRLPGFAVAAVEAVVWVAAMTAMFGGATAILWIIPSAATIELVPTLVASAIQDVATGAAPLNAGFALSFVIVGAVGLLALAIDHVVLTARMPLLAAVGLVAVSLVPSLAVPGDIDLAAFILLAAAILFLLRTDTRERHRAREASAPRPARRGPGRSESTPPGFGGASATALGIGAIAVIVAVVAGPLLPTPVARAGGGGIGGTGTRIDPTLELGDDLRRPREVDVLTVRSTAPSPPYLRVVTLSRFDGAVWQPDDGPSLPLQDEGALPALETADEIEVTTYRTSVEILDLDSPWLPVPYPAVGVEGLDGDWNAFADNRTFVAGSGSTQGQTYEVTSTLPRPSLEQIRARAAGGVGEQFTALPDDMPPVIAERAQEVTAEAGSDYDALLALQSWFRGPDFAYSLDAPVEDGFDGTGADAVADFLVQREGYCVHFASAFALMARSMDMPTRIVVGYLPGVSAGTPAQGETLFTVSSGQLHAWPEVHFEGIGWVPFEPTNSLGVPTSFAPRTTPNANDPGATDPQEPQQPTTAPTTTPTGPAPQLDDDLAGGAPGTSTTGTAASPIVGVGAIALLALLAPAVLREIRRRRALAAASAGEPAAAWAAVQDLAIDLGVPVPAAESPRVFGNRLVRDHGAPPEEMTVLVRAIERASYAADRSGRHTAFGEGDAYAEALSRVRAGMLADAGGWRRIHAIVMPRSLVVRPGGAYAETRVGRVAPAR